LIVGLTDLCMPVCQLSREVVARSELSQGGGCSSAVCVEDLLLQLLEHEALSLPAFTAPPSHTPYQDLSNIISDIVPSSVTHVLALLDGATAHPLLACPARPSAFLATYLRQRVGSCAGDGEGEGPGAGDVYPVMCRRWGEAMTAACPCALADLVSRCVSWAYVVSLFVS
jgi:hypothetical protein